MHTENAPRPTDNPAVAGKPSASDNSHDNRRLASSLISAAFKPFVSARLSKPQDQQTQDQQTRKDATAPSVMPLFMAALLCCAALNSALAGNKLVDDLKHNEIQEKGFSLHFDKDRQQLQVNGTMDIGILPAFENMLSKYPESTEVAFNSNGGNIYQARGLARVIISNALNTYVSENCYSACTLAYVAGKTRTMGPNGKLGFHQYNMRSRPLNQRVDVEKEQARDLSYFKSRIPDNIFIKKIFNSKNSELWVPEQKDLLASGAIHEIVPEASAHRR